MWSHILEKSFREKQQFSLVDPTVSKKPTGTSLFTNRKPMHLLCQKLKGLFKKIGTVPENLEDWTF